MAGLTVEEYLASGSDAPAQPNFSIYQVPRGPEGRDFRYRSYEGLQVDGLSVDRKNYQLVYTARWIRIPLWTRFTIGSIWNIPLITRDVPLSGDIVVFRQNGKQTAYYVDSIGYRGGAGIF